MKRRRFDREFKRGILRELEGKTLAQVCKEQNLIPNVLDYLISHIVKAVYTFIYKQTKGI